MSACTHCGSFTGHNSWCSLPKKATLSSYTPDTGTQELREALEEWHIDFHHCDDEGYGCEYVTDESGIRKHTYCRLQDDGYKKLEALMNTRIAAVLDRALEKKQTYYRYSPYAVVEAVPVKAIQALRKEVS